MYLKRLELQGFKSFADKTVIDFENEITGVVGPNGSGKSNISDSIRWVLGEQSAKTLRGSKMEDIIFAGTSSRRPLGFAEVTLVLDNKDSAMPIDYTEVSVTRRVFRSGESEYYINKTGCRLKDIKELFMDTGVGIDGYSIIGQGKIDEILSSKSEDRRNLFEEAAGIVKYKTRKNQSEKKLNKTKDNLLRINDIITELDKQIMPLKQQSKKAQEYLNLSSDLKDLEVSLYTREIKRLNEQSKHLENQKELIEKQLKYNEEKKNEIDENYNKIKKNLEAVESKIEQVQNLRYKTQSELERKESEIKLNNEKITFLKKELNRLNLEKEQLNDNIEEYQNEIKNISQQKKEMEGKIQDENLLLSKKQEELKVIESKIMNNEKEIEEKKSDIIQVLNDIADKKSEINTLNSFNENIEKQIKELLKEIDEKEILTKEKEKDILKSEDKILDKKKTIKNLLDEKENIKNDKEDTKVKLDKLIREKNNLKGEIQGKISRYNLLNDMKREYEGFYRSVKNTLKACRNNTHLGKGVRGVIAELISVDKNLEKAIEISLGSNLQNIVTETEENAKNIINYLKKNKLGRVTFLPMTSIKGRTLNLNKRRVLDINGVIGIASNLVKYKEDYEEIFKYLLGRILIVKDINVGIKVAKLCNHSFRIVSLDGDVLNPGGSLTGGSYNSRNTKLLGRKRQIKELKSEIKEYKAKYKEIDQKVNKKDEKLRDLEKTLNDLVERINVENIELTKLENIYSKEVDTKDNLTKEIKMLKEELKQLNKQNEETTVNKSTLIKDLNKLKEKNNLTQDTIDNMMEDFDEEKQKKESLSKDITEIKVKSASYKQEMVSFKNSLEQINKNIQKIKENLNTKKNEYKENEKEIEELKNNQSKLNNEKDKLKNLLSEYDSKVTESKNKKVTLSNKFDNQQAILKDMDKKINDLQKSLNTLDIKQTKYNMQLENYNNKLWDEYEMTYKMALNSKKEIENVTKVQSEIRNLKRKIKNLGNVNINSIKEYKDVKERYEFLNEQREDLLKAKESLKKVIKDMEVKMKEQFISNFHIIKENFKEVFNKLFGGGKADIYLEDDEDVLGSGIEIIAQPPGKKLQNISLLSGGEKALTAIALLFAILKLKPTPFCILDEIEAALDDANVYRFADYLQEYSNKTQFIVITHRKGTMESVDTLYGVTMEEKGVSKLVSVKLTEKLKEKVS
ncbi:MAG: chromosome segregation protein SMC [Firmicutes bacterium]|nr:chromosome segregation protein SMC [Bacillota bacterium]